MEYDDFIKLSKRSNPSEKLSGVLLALWYALNDNWEIAHNIVQDIETKTAYWIHAYLHRLEGDLNNAEYWYKRANKNPSRDPLKSELEFIIQAVLLDSI